MTDEPRFAHASEAELARILDYYGVRWQYEPRTFPIQWNLDGMVVESFAPDFFLPDLDLYVELTTLKQSLVRRKNRKLRRLRELYPDVRIKLFYGKDFKALMLKYGRLDIAASHSGLEGQALAARATRAAATIVPAVPVNVGAAALAPIVPTANAVTSSAPTFGTAADVPGRKRGLEVEPDTLDEAGRPSRGSRRRRGRRQFSTAA